MCHIYRIFILKMSHNYLNYIECCGCNITKCEKSRGLNKFVVTMYMESEAFSHE